MVHRVLITHAGGIIRVQNHPEERPNLAGPPHRVWSKYSTESQLSIVIRVREADFGPLTDEHRQPMLEFGLLTPLHRCTMTFLLHPWQLLLVILAGWVNQQQQQIIDFQRTEIDVLKEKLGKKRILLNDDQRRRLG